jgi:hypothetical protein
MANKDHLRRLRQGVDAWNAWRKKKPSVRPDLTKANLQEANLSGANLQEANLRGADLWRADLCEANLWRADLRRADLSEADLGGANLCEATLRRTDLRWALLADADLKDADLTGCSVYGVSAWALKLSPSTKQQDLVITPPGEPKVTLDNIEVAQFVYLLMCNEKIRDAIDTIGKKGVLLLGRFTGGRVAILESLRDELRKRDFLPIVFNFDKPKTKDFTETVRLLAGLSRFVIVDITNPRSAPLELQATVPDYMIPFAPIIQEGEPPFSTFKDLWVKYQWVLKPISYTSTEELVQGLDKGIVEPALAKFKELVKKKADEMSTRPMRDIIGR